ncbi:unnamed protein product [Moneuplotes crassus]|uniref:Uncharacterized protein n=1 Tax=Euplotes crassus TaxID=5936 RepID=A0AAD1Y2X2_EUPCR|nr:unnamed protein product [Moneuplotes crassus]
MENNLKTISTKKLFNEELKKFHHPKYNKDSSTISLRHKISSTSRFDDCLCNIDSDSDPLPAPQKVPLFQYKFNFTERKGKRRQSNPQSHISEENYLQPPMFLSDSNYARPRIKSACRDLKWIPPRKFGDKILSSNLKEESKRIPIDKSYLYYDEDSLIQNSNSKPIESIISSKHSKSESTPGFGKPDNNMPTHLSKMGQSKQSGFFPQRYVKSPSSLAVPRPRRRKRSKNWANS